jgi:hypothetical protein
MLAADHSHNYIVEKEICSTYYIYSVQKITKDMQIIWMIRSHYTNNK